MSANHSIDNPLTVSLESTATLPGDATARLRRVADAILEQRSTEEWNVVVLLVDDQLMVGESVRRTLADEPNVVFHFCRDPNEAQAMAERISPTVILQDLVMPAIDGLTLVRRYRTREATRDIPIVVLSTREDPKTKSDAFTAGANDYMVKLPDKLELVARIRYHSQAHLNRVQRDAAYRALHESQRQLLEANIELQRLSNLDPLTGLNNRRRFDEYAATEWRRAWRDKTPIALLLIDIDYFKHYNDAYGHLAGDSILRRIGEVLRSGCGRPADLPARYGGDEFVAALPGVNASAALMIGERLRQMALDLKIAHKDSPAGPYLSLSIGGASAIPSESTGLLDLIDAADKQLYDAKARGRNQVLIAA